MKPMNHRYQESLLVVLLSGGKGSFASAFLLKYLGYENVLLYFNDTKSEDPDSYRFIAETRDKLAWPLVSDSDGRDIFQVFKDRRFMGNSRIDPCSEVLKRNRSAAFRKRFKPNDVRFFIGVGVWEKDRLDRAAPFWEPYRISSVLVDEEIYDEQKLIAEITARENIALPSMYGHGFTHNNCGGFCVKAGLAHYAQLYKTCPERYLAFERREAEVYAQVPTARPFLRKTLNKKTTYITLREYRQQYLDLGWSSAEEPLTTCNSCAIADY
jgi:hypothetical protein